jgi:L-asparagine transporter-like permease
MRSLFSHFQETLLAAFISLTTFFAPAAGILLVVLGFVFFDIVTAYLRVKKDKKKWTSRRFINGFLRKMIGYTMCVLLFFMLDKFLLNEFTKYFITVDFLSTKFVSLGLIYSELKSIDENFKKIYGKGLIQMIIDMLKFGNKFKDEINDINKEKEDGESNTEG